MTGKRSPRPSAFRGATRVNFGRLCHRMHSPVGALSDKCIGGAPTRALSPRRWENQHGRTLLEMLAVLAIIGVLSVAAIAGLQWAFAKYKANNTIHDVHVWELAALDSNQLYDMTTSELVLAELGNTSTHGYPMAIQVQDKDVFSITVNNVPKRVCRRMLDMIDDTMLVSVNDVKYDGTDLCDTDTNQFAFYFNKYMGDVGTICIPSCTGEERCCNNACQIIQTPCGSDGCTDCGSDYCTTSNTCCPTPTATKCGDEDCCDTKCCNGVCCAESYMTCDETTTCGCPNNMVPDAQTGTCKCPDDAPYYFEEANLCCQSGYTPLDGVCQKIDCRGGPINYECYLNDKLCGYNCGSSGRDCQNGICYADYCTQDEAFNEFPFTYPGNYHYGCLKVKNAQITCGRAEESRHNRWYCYLNDTPQEYCCQANNTSMECTNGICENLCPSGWIYELNGGSCTKDNLVCQYTSGTWTCYRNNVLCGNGCTDLTNCGSCQDVQSGCAGGLIWNDETQRCESNDMYCIAHSTLGYQQCYKYDNSSCGMYYVGNGQHASASGNCVDPGCPDGMMYGQVNGAYWGCIDSKIGNKGLACYYNGSYRPAECRYNQQICGRRCDYDGTDCGSVYLPQCALAGHCPQTGYDMSDGCTCDGNVTFLDGTDYCCPSGHTYTNGACTLL